MTMCVRRYRYQLEAFMDKVRGRTPEHWYDAQDSITNMEWIEAVYQEVSRSFFLRWALTIVFRRPGWDPVLHRQPRCQCKYNPSYFVPQVVAKPRGRRHLEMPHALT